MLLMSVLMYVTSLSVTSLLLLSLTAFAAVVLRRKGYGMRLGFASVIVTALPGSRRFPDGANVRITTRIVPFLLTGCRGPWLDLSTSRFVMRLRPAAPALRTTPSAVRRSFAALSSALSVESSYHRIVAHNVAVHAVVFFLRGVRLRAERVHIWRQDAHWAFKADQFVYVGHAVGLFGSRYDLSVNELSLLADRHPVGSAPAPEAASGGPPSSAGASVSPSVQLATAIAAAAAAAAARTTSDGFDSARLFMSVPDDFTDLPQPTLTPHSSMAPITTLTPPPGVRPLSDAAEAVTAAAPAPSPSSPTAALPSPLRLSLVLRKGVHFSALLTPRFLTVLRPRRMAIMDDISLSADIRDVSARAAHVASLRLEAATLTLCPGYSRSLRAKLPPSAPSTRRPRKPGLLRYWECSGRIHGVSARLVPPPMPAAPYATPGAAGSTAGAAAAAPAPADGVVGGGGLFATFKSASLDACGMAADERQEAMCKATFSVEQVYAGSTAVETSARGQCELLAQIAPPTPLSSSPQRRRDAWAHDGSASGDAGSVRTGGDGESDGEEEEEEGGHVLGEDRPPPLEPDAVQALEAFVAARPEAVLWLASVGACYDMNCAKRDALRLDVSSDGAVLAVEPAGLLRIMRNAAAFSCAYTVVATPEAVAAYLSPSLSASPSDSSGSLPPLSPPAPSAELPEGFSTSLAGAAPAAAAGGGPSPSSVGLGEREASACSQHNLSRSSSMSSFGSGGGDSGEAGALLFGCDLKRCHAIVLGDGPVGEGDTLAVIFGAEQINVPRMIHSRVPGGGLRVVADVTNLRVDHWSPWARTANLVCERGSFTNMSKSSAERREVSVVGLSVDWDLDLQSALEELPDRFLRLARVSADPALAEYLRALRLVAAAAPSPSTSQLLASLMSAPPSTGASHAQSAPARSPPPSTADATFDADTAALAAVERRERRERRRERFLRLLDTWVLSGADVRVAASFPDGPRLSARAVEVPSFCLSDERYVLRHVVVSLSGAKCMYAEGFSVLNPVHSMGRLSSRRHVDVVVTTFRASMPHEYWFGLLLQDWIIRLKAVLKVSREARYRRRGLQMPRYRKKPFPDLHLLFSDVEVSIADHPVDAFLTKALPLMQDEAAERERRYRALGESVRLMEENNTATADGTRRLKALLDEEDSSIYVRRMKEHMAALGEHHVAPGFLPPLDGPPLARLTAATIKVELTMDEATRKLGSAESVRKLKTFDPYLLGPQTAGKRRQYEPDAWNSIGFRDVAFDAVGVRLRFRDFPSDFMSIDRMYFDEGTVIGLAQEATVAPHLSEATVAIGRRRLVTVVKSVASTKTFADIHLVADVLEATYNPAYIGSVVQFGRAFTRFLAGGKNPSPRMAWFDSTRAAQHGRFRITARTLKGIMSSSISPYTETSHYVNVVADNVSMLMSRLPATDADRDPISWEVHNWRILPSVFRDDVQSAVVFKFVKVGLSPVPETLDGDAQDHYLFPLATKEQVEAGGAGVGRALMIPSTVDGPVSARLNPSGCYTGWTSPLLTDGDPCYDSYKTFRTERMHLGVRVVIRQAPGVVRPTSAVSSSLRPSRRDGEDAPMFWAPEGASMVHSDAITTLMKVVGRIVRRPVFNRAPARWNYPGRRPPCSTGLPYRVMSLEFDLDVSDVNVMLYNNFELGHGLFVSVHSVRAGISKASVRVPSDKPGVLEGTVKETRVVRRSAELSDLYTALRMPELDFADNATGCGFLFSVSSLRLQPGAARDERGGGGGREGQNLEPRAPPAPAPAISSRVMSSGFGDNEDTSPFYTFFSRHPLQRGKKLDKVDYRQVLSIDGIRFLWSPRRRNSVLSWPDAFVEKTFVMKGVGSDGPSRHDPLHEKACLQQRVVPPDASPTPASVCSPAASSGGAVTATDGGASDSSACGVQLRHPSREASNDPCGMVQFDGGGATGRRRHVTSSDEEEHFSADEDSSDPEATAADAPATAAAAAAAAAGAVAAQSGGRAVDGRPAESPPVTFRKPADDPAKVAVKRQPLAAWETDGDLFDLIDPYLAPEGGTSSSRRPTKSGAGPGGGQDRLGRRASSTGGAADGGRRVSGEDGAFPRPSALVTCHRTVLGTNAKFQLMVTDSQVCFGAPDADSLVVLTSESASVGFVDKTIEQKLQLGESSEKWVDAEYRVYLQRSRLYAQSERLDTFRFYERWVPREADAIDDAARLASIISPLTRVTVRPISFNVMYIRAKSVAKSDDDDTVDNVLRPSQLFINVPYVSMDSTRVEFHSVTDVVRKVLMQRIPNSEVIEEELALLRYNMQLAGGRLSPKDLNDYGRRLHNITKQFLYAGETFQPHLVRALVRPEDGDFAANYVRYKARAKAVATYVRTERRASGRANLFPTMYISYSFDQCSWKLRDLKTKKPFVELILTDLVCRHIFYVGKGSSSEFTFGNINAINHQEGGFYKGILHPSGESLTRDAPVRVSSTIKASDGTSVAFRWFATQMEHVGGIPVYDLLTINVSPLNAAISTNLYRAVLEFAFGTSDFADLRKIATAKNKGAGGAAGSPSAGGGAPRPAGDAPPPPPAAASSDAGSADGGALGRAPTRLARGPPADPSPTVSPTRGHPRRRGGRGDGGVPAAAAAATASMLSAVAAPLHARTRSQDVQDMSQRGQSTMIFKYIYIGAFQLTASYKKREDPDAHSVMDITDLTVHTPSYMYSSEIWTWRDFAREVKKELLLSFAVRGVSNLAKIKLLPGYQRVRRRVRQGTDTVNGLRHGLFDRAAGGPEAAAAEDERASSRASCSDDDDGGGGGDAQRAISSKILDGTRAEDDARRRLLLQLLFGSRGATRATSAEAPGRPAPPPAVPGADAGPQQASGERPPQNPRPLLPGRSLRGTHRRRA